MNKSGFTTTILIFFVVSALIIGSGVYFWQSKSKLPQGNTVNNVIPFPCSRLEDTKESNKRTRCVQEYQNVNESCEKIVDSQKRMQCNSEYNESESMAIFERGNIEECSTLKGRIERATVSATGADYCNYLFAIKNNNSSLCDNLENGSIIRSRCYADLSIKNADFSLCENVDNTLGRPDFCKISLGLDIGRNAKRVSECSTITDNRYQQACIFGVAESTKDPKLCAMISINEFVEAFNFSKDECLRRVQNSPSGKPVN